MRGWFQESQWGTTPRLHTYDTWVRYGRYEKAKVVVEP
jgi:hypothetical protein